MQKNKQKLNQNVQVANKQYAYLLGGSVDAEHGLVIFERLRKKEFTTGTIKQDNWLEKILLSHIVIKLHSIFDDSRDAICLENFIIGNAVHIASKENIKNISNKLNIVKTKHNLLIQQLEYNRHENAHIPSKSKLGVTEEIAVKIRKLGEITNNQGYINQKSVSGKKMRFSVGNFPVKEAKELSDQLSKLIFGILYPKTLK